MTLKPSAATPPRTGEEGRDARMPEASLAVSLFAVPSTDAPAPGRAGSGGGLSILKKRSDFLRAAQGRRQGTAGFLLQAHERGDALPATRVGFTASKKVGNAVCRNRAKRRLRALARDLLPGLGRPGWDYVLVAKPGVTPVRDFADLIEDLRRALMQIHPPPAA